MSSIYVWLLGTTDLFVKYGSVGLFLLAFAESSFFPIPPDLVLIPLALISPRRALWYALVCTTASVVGGVFGYLIGRYAGYPLLRKVASLQRIQQIEDIFARYGGWGVAIAGFTPIPYKLFTIAAGVFRMRQTEFVLASIVGRGLRFFLEGWLLMVYGQAILDFLAKYFELLTFGLTILLVMLYLGLSRLRKAVGLSRRVDQQVGQLKDWVNAWWLKCIVPLGKLGTYVLVGLSLAGFFLLLLAKLIEDLLGNELGYFDQLITAGITSLRTEPLTELMKLLTTLGSPGLLVPAALVLGLTFIFWFRHVWEAVTFWLCLLGAWGLIELLKELFARPRPAGVPLIEAAGYSFPSGHSLLAMVFYGFLIYVSWLKVQNLNLRLILTVFLSLLILGVGVSRVYLGVHYPSDVLGGFAAGGFWLISFILGSQGLRHRRRRPFIVN
ncbi:MAG: phosphatase PAP2 family protein [Firmicutes bacterium]|nr:phosphatase PAP2 family protein [Bacillota bacterium]